MMMRTGWISIAAMALTIASGPVQGQELSNGAGPSNTETTELTIDLPACKRDMQAWKVFSPRKLDIDPKLWNDPYFKKRIEESDARWRKEDVIDVTWVDIDGDGWCDAITSGDKEPYKNAKGKPTLLFQPRAIYIRTGHGFIPFREGMITEQYEGSSFTIYWDTQSHSAVIFTRVYQGNAVGGIGEGSDEFHLRQMLRASFAAHKAGRAEEENDYYVEVESFLYTTLQIPRATSKRIWAEEAERAGVDLAFPFLN
ncbi:hypothetical protein SOM08_15725 [Hydrogenophaga sp. SNF1]|uniref:hypothetical protein n=1 Tax=Hydrogenophaga sp. SNF1 TaxID=3098762 RepID=UPI002ACC041C|nr:hypothetical protein [Hydrogenophaga sp. SNF1]WQB82440.1 hypothetical protein SOM08_15725 [Hydrogenophaga sp. SNF1]